MSVYFIVEAKVIDKEVYAQYVEKVRSIVESYNGRYLARGGRVVPIVGDWNPDRVIIIEFPAIKDMKRWFASSEYKEIAPLRERSAVTRAILVEGEG
ncbi:MAG: DUF1330 domain-containing protein [Candidatus Omnitrophica bacterium]|nr:DUF1330 domain-containing protein [Candidatus Omnitrophota bacterium]MBU1870452.1 DUF1330 domain-containing protein [Candidatus Omnitrophota bacterium]